MSHLYITQSDLKIGFSENCLTVKTLPRDETEEQETTEYPIETVDSVNVFGSPALSSTVLQELLTRNIDLNMYRSNGNYLGKLHNPMLASIDKLRLQACAAPDFNLSLAKIIISGKIKNQLYLLNVHKTEEATLSGEIAKINTSLKNIKYAVSIAEVNGFEGIAARYYFSALSQIVPKEFTFTGRSKNPPLDPFNAMISFGYSQLYRNMVGAIERHGFSPYFGILHQDKENHCSLASDLLEEWRSLIIDDTVINLLKNNFITPQNFYEPNEHGGVFMDKPTIKLVSDAFSDKIVKSKHYLRYDELKYGFQYAVDRQLFRFYDALSQNNPELYMPASLEDAT